MQSNGLQKQARKVNRGLVLSVKDCFAQRWLSLHPQLYTLSCHTDLERGLHRGWCTELPSKPLRLWMTGARGQKGARWMGRGRHAPHSSSGLPLSSWVTVGQAGNSCVHAHPYPQHQGGIFKSPGAGGGSLHLTHSTGDENVLSWTLPRVLRNALEIPLGAVEGSHVISPQGYSEKKGVITDYLTTFWAGPSSLSLHLGGKD